MAKYSDMNPKPNVKKNIFGKPKTTYSYKMDEGGSNIVRMKTKAVKKIGGGKWAYETTTAPKQTPGRIKYYKKSSGGGLSLFGGRKKSNASTAKGMRPKNTSDMKVCKPGSRKKGCRPGGK